MDARPLSVCTAVPLSGCSHLLTAKPGCSRVIEPEDTRPRMTSN